MAPGLETGNPSPKPAIENPRVAGSIPAPGTTSPPPKTFAVLAPVSVAPRASRRIAPPRRWRAGCPWTRGGGVQPNGAIAEAQEDHQRPYAVAVGAASLITRIRFECRCEILRRASRLEAHGAKWRSTRLRSPARRPYPGAGSFHGRAKSRSPQRRPRGALSPSVVRRATANGQISSPVAVPEPSIGRKRPIRACFGVESLLKVQRNIVNFFTAGLRPAHMPAEAASARPTFCRHAAAQHRYSL
jgi:hypothetical protein